jgi:hypothetical protein
VEFNVTWARVMMWILLVLSLAGCSHAPTNDDVAAAIKRAAAKDCSVSLGDINLSVEIETEHALGASGDYDVTANINGNETELMMDGAMTWTLDDSPGSLGLAFLERNFADCQ